MSCAEITCSHRVRLPNSFQAGCLTPSSFSVPVAPRFCGELCTSALNSLVRTCMEIQPRQNNLLIPVAIVIAGALIAGAVYLGGATGDGAIVPQAGAQTGDMEQMNAIASGDHIRGNPDAPVIIVEYSDFECPFCKRFHETMQQATAEYGDQVAWVYRHFPLDQLHSKARKEAVASECASELVESFAERAFEI